jgi:hypothetical protein
MRSATAPATIVAAAALNAQWKKKRCQLLSDWVFAVVLAKAKSPAPMKGLANPSFSPKAKPLLQNSSPPQQDSQACWADI